LLRSIASRSISNTGVISLLRDPGCPISAAFGPLSEMAFSLFQVQFTARRVAGKDGGLVPWSAH